MSQQNKTLKVGFAQNSYTSDIAGNQALNAQSIRDLAAQGAQLIVLPELHDSLYFCQVESVDNFDLAVSLADDSATVRFYSELARECGVVLVSSLFERRSAGLYHNTSIVFEKDGSLAGRYRKMHIPDDPAYYEKFYFTPGDIGFEPI